MSEPSAPGWVQRFNRACEAIGVALFALLFLTFIVQVTARYAFGAALAWTDELAVVLYLWAMLWGAALVCAPKEHVAFDLLYANAPPHRQRAMALGAALLVGLPLAWALPATLDYIHFMGRESTPVLGWSLQWVDAPFGLLVLAAVVRCGITVWRLFSAQWRAEL